MPAEVNSPEYQRQAVTLDELGSNINAITFPTALTTWGKLDEIGLFDGVIAGKKIASQKIPPQFINQGDTVEIPAKNLVISSACPNLPAISLPSPNIIIIKDFDINNWILNAGQYELDISHSFETKYPRVEIKDEADNDIESPYIPITTNLIRFYLPLEPECRFKGKAIIGI